MSTAQRYFTRQGAEMLMDRQVDQIAFGTYSDDPNVPTCEIMLTWIDMTLPGSARRLISPRLEAFDETWAGLAAMPDVLQWLASVSMPGFSKPSITPDEAEKAFLALGFKNSRA